MNTFSLYRHRCLCWLVALLFVGVSAPSIRAAGRFEVTPAVRSAYQKIISLRLVEARTELDALKRSDPDNLLALLLENYLECGTAALNDSKSQYRQWSKGMDKRLDRISRGDRNSPYYLYCQGEIRLQWAVLRGRYGDYLSCVSDVKQGYALLEENQRRFPDFVANKKALGLIHAAVGNIPDELRWAVKGFGGMSGTIAQGTAEMEEVLAYSRQHPDFLFGTETLVAYCYLMLHLGNQGETAWTQMKAGLSNELKTNPLASFALANVGMKTGRNDEAIRYLQEMPTGAQFHPFPYRYFLLGLAKTYRLDADANSVLERFLNEYKGDVGIKETYQKMAWNRLLQGDQQGYWNYIYQAKIQGVARADTDKAANREANSGEMPDARLLRARILFDGGYYQRAYDELLKNGGNTYSSHRKNNLEYAYRLGRICHKMNRTSEAVRYYQQTIDGGYREPWFFACNAAFQLGDLYEDRQEWANARAAYQRCLKIDPDEYAMSLHARAKAGLNRLKGK